LRRAGVIRSPLAETCACIETESTSRLCLLGRRDASRTHTIACSIIFTHAHSSLLRSLRGRASASAAKGASVQALGGLALIAAGAAWAAQETSFGAPAHCAPAAKVPSTGVPGTDKVRENGTRAAPEREGERFCLGLSVSLCVGNCRVDVLSSLSLIHLLFLLLSGAHLHRYQARWRAAWPRCRHYRPLREQGLQARGVEDAVAHQGQGGEPLL